VHPRFSREGGCFHCSGKFWFWASVLVPYPSQGAFVRLSTLSPKDATLLQSTKMCKIMKQQLRGVPKGNSPLSLVPLSLWSLSLVSLVPLPRPSLVSLPRPSSLPYSLPRSSLIPPSSPSSLFRLSFVSRLSLLSLPHPSLSLLSLLSKRFIPL
jgi:hypothetical protein